MGPIRRPSFLECLHKSLFLRIRLRTDLPLEEEYQHFFGEKFIFQKISKESCVQYNKWRIKVAWWYRGIRPMKGRRKQIQRLHSVVLCEAKDQESPMIHSLLQVLCTYEKNVGEKWFFHCLFVCVRKRSEGLVYTTRTGTNYTKSYSNVTKMYCWRVTVGNSNETWWS
jgi:hypothetical protein